MAHLETIHEGGKQTPTPEDFCFLANTFTEQGEFDKAILLYESACRLFPDNLALKINLGRVRSLKNQAFDSPRDILSSGSRPIPNEPPLQASRFQGLGNILLKNGRVEEARRVFELSKESDPTFYLAYLNLARLYFDSGAIPQAIKELERAEELNPFSEDVAALLSEAYFKNRDYKSSLDAAIDAFILSGETSEKSPKGSYPEQIKKVIEKIPGFTNKMRNDRIRERRNRKTHLYEELTAELLGMPTPTESSSVAPSSTTSSTDPVSPSNPEIPLEPDPNQLYEISARLRRHLIFRNMEDEAVLKVARFTSETGVLKSDLAYQEGDPIYGLYLIAKGKVEIQKSTPFGPITFATFETGSFFGDDNLLSGRERYTSAVAVHDTQLLFIDKAGLANIFARERKIAIHFLWYFWKSLSYQIREANDRMTSFFANVPGSAHKSGSPLGPPGGRPTHVEIDKKLEVLQTKGLSSKELSLLAKFSNEEVFNLSETIFREGDLGDRLYIVLKGSVLISKRIAGAGEEALALLRTGDFFGEMALVGQHHRSADAKAQEQGTTVLVVTKEAVREILSIDTNSAYQFLNILCRILSQRLVEIHEKIYQWRVMSGEFQ